MIRLDLRLLGALAVASLLAACASAPVPAAAPSLRMAPRAPAAVASALAVPAREHVRLAMEMLGRGEPLPARTELTAALAEEPYNPAARRLLDQIDRDPRALLGERSYPYKIRPGESLSSLAERFLGDPLLFYALARYNGIDAPDTAEVGRILLIPGVPKKPAPAAKAAATAPLPGANPARASDLRRRALEDMDKGSIDLAVALLQQAAPLDPANTLIRGDLDRALRIQASLKKR